MEHFRFETKTTEMLADILTPVSIYLKIRDIFPNSILLEGADFKAGDNQYSFVAMNPVASIKIENKNCRMSYPGGKYKDQVVDEGENMVELLQGFIEAFEEKPYDKQLPVSGLFGYTTYEAVRFFENVHVAAQVDHENIPDLFFQFYQFVIVVNHTSNRITIVEHLFDGDQSRISFVKEQLKNRVLGEYPFVLQGDENCSVSDNDFLEMVEKGKKHCLRGDVFQIVLSRRFSHKFKGDEFNVYRTLRSINPSPYMFYFDFGNFKLFGSSPESQVKIQNGRAFIHPIAGTFKRTGNDARDQDMAVRLAEDPKENSEHVMLVDLARNDLSRSAERVQVDYFREIHYYSHVLHMVSQVSGIVRENVPPFQVFADTFPAGTLSGAPKVKAMELIHKYENRPRGYYGGCIGNIGHNGDVNLAIMIRSFMSKNNTLQYQAGAGIVADSVDENERNEVDNKLAALRSAMEQAQDF